LVAPPGLTIATWLRIRIRSASPAWSRPLTGSPGEGQIIFGRKLTGRSGDPDHREATVSLFNIVSLCYNYVATHVNKFNDLFVVKFGLPEE